MNTKNLDIQFNFHGHRVHTSLVNRATDKMAHLGNVKYRNCLPYKGEGVRGSYPYNGHAYTVLTVRITWKNIAGRLPENRRNSFAELMPEGNDWDDVIWS